MIRISLFAPRITSAEYGDGWIFGLAQKEPGSDPQEVLRLFNDIATLKILDGEGPLVSQMIKRHPEVSRVIPPRRVEQVTKAIEGTGPSTRQQLREGLTMNLRSIAEKYYVQVSPSEALKEFYSLPRDHAAVCHFLRKYGVFRRENLSPPSRPPKLVKKFWKSALEGNERPFALRFDEFWYERDQLKEMMELYSKSKPQMQQDQERAAQVASKAERIEAAEILAIEIERQLAGARLTVSLGGDVPQPSLTTDFVLPAMYAHFWNRIVQECPLGECLKCGKVIEVDRPKKQYCSLSCQQAAKQKRYRQKSERRKSQKRRK